MSPTRQPERGEPRQRDAWARLRSSDLTFAIGVTLVAFALRLWIGAALFGEPVWDGHYYDYYARRIADGFGYTDARVVDGLDIGHPSCHYPVGFSAVLGFLYRWFGNSARTVITFQALTGALTVTCVWRLAGRALGAGREARWRQRIAAVLACLHPGLVLQSALVMSEGLATFTLLAALVAASEVTARKGGRAGALTGAFGLGLSALVRPPALFLLPFLLLLWPTSGRWPRRLRELGLGAVALGAVALLPIAPWTARNCQAMDSCALISTNGGWNLAIGAFPRATGRFETLRSSDGCREVSGQVHQDRCWLHYGLEHIKTEPGRWLALIPRKLHYTFDHESFPVEYLHQARPEAWPEPRREQGRELLTQSHRLLVLLAAAALIRVPRSLRRARSSWRAGAALALVLGLAFFGLGSNDPWIWPLALCAAIAPLVHRDRPEAQLLGGLVLSVALTATVFFGEDRYHMVASPALCVLAAFACAPPRRAQGPKQA